LQKYRDRKSRSKKNGFMSKVLALSVF
jgi:hypothetical protein